MEVIHILSVIVSIIATGTITVLAFIVGARTAQKVNRGEEIKMPTLNPMQAYQEHREHVEATKEQERMNTMLENINNYTGDGTGQKNII